MLKKLLVLMILVGTAGLSGCMPGAPGQTKGMATVSASGLMDRLSHQEAMVLVDVRQPEELLGPLGALPGVVNIPLPDLPSRYQEIPKDQEVVLICRSGSRSSQAYAFLADHGYTHLLNLSGGMVALRRVHQP